MCIRDSAGAAVMLQESDLTEQGKLLEALTGLLGDPARLAAMAAAARTQAHPCLLYTSGSLDVLHSHQG